jgi:hypothetical protein
MIQNNSQELYLTLLKKCLTREIFEDSFSKRKLAVGKGYPPNADTMIGYARLDNLQECIIDVLEKNVPGDLIETGVWRGGAAILMRAVLKAWGDVERCVWLADSFEGLPRPNGEKYPEDAGDTHWLRDKELAVTLETVKNNFSRYELLDAQVKFIEGWFSETLHKAPVEKLAILRLDGDMYESTINALEALYPKLSVGGYLIIDDHALISCESAVEDYRNKYNITEAIQTVDWTGVYWIKEQNKEERRA